MVRVVLALGSNLGDRLYYLQTAERLLHEKAGEIVAKSKILQTEPWGFVSENLFANSVLILETDLTPEQLLDTTQQIECEIGRTEKSHDGAYADRVIDIDIIDYDGVILQTPRLTLPHALMHKRAFVLQPLCEIWPDWQHPTLHKTATELLQKFFE